MSGGGSQQAPTPYQPAYQSSADQQFQAGAGQLSTAGNTLYNQVAPQLAQVASNVTGNPYLPQAMTGAQGAANTATGQVAPSQLQGLAGLTALGNTAAGAAPSILNQGFDPQAALYNQQYQQMIDQSRVTAAQSGLGGSPFAAGLENMAGQNFNLGWQNNLLNRQATAANAYGTMTGAANTAYSGASNEGISALQTLAGAAQLPYDLYLQQQQAQLAALGAQAQGTNAALAPTQQAISDQGQYLNIGQTASQGAIQAAQVNNQAAAASAAGFGNLFGSLTGMFDFGNPFAGSAEA